MNGHVRRPACGCVVAQQKPPCRPVLTQASVMSLPLLRLLGVLLVLVVISPGAQSKERPMLAVLDFASGGAELTQEELSLLSDVSRAEARRVLGGAYTIITQESIEQLLKAHGKTLEQCQGSCETETGKLLGAELVVSGRLVKAFGAYKANLKLHRTEPPELLDARVLTVNTLPALEGAVRQGTAQILASLAPASSKTTSAPSRPTAPNPSTTTRPSTREALERTERDMARSLAQRTSSRTSQKEARKRALDAAAKKAAKKSARKAAKKSARKAARKVAKRTARSRVKKATRARPKRAAKQQGKPARCQGIPWTCIGWIEDGVRDCLDLNVARDLGSVALAPHDALGRRVLEVRCAEGDVLGLALFLPQLLHLLWARRRRLSCNFKLRRRRQEAA